MVSGMAVAATSKYPNETVDVAFNPVGRVVGQLAKSGEKRRGDRAVGRGVPRATNRLNELNEAAASV